MLSFNKERMKGPIMGTIPAPIFFGTLIHSGSTDSADQISALWILPPILLTLIFCVWFIRKVNKAVRKFEKEESGQRDKEQKK